MNWFVAHSPKHVFRHFNLHKVNPLTTNMRGIVKSIFLHTHARTINEPIGKATFRCQAVDVGRGYLLQIQVAWEKCTQGLLRLHVLIAIVAIAPLNDELAAGHTVH